MSCLKKTLVFEGKVYELIFNDEKIATLSIKKHGVVFYFKSGLEFLDDIPYEDVRHELFAALTTHDESAKTLKIHEQTHGRLFNLCL